MPQPAPHWSEKLETLEACPEGVEFAKQFPTIEAAWAACKRGDHMLWLCGEVAGPPGDDSRRPLVLAACDCARLVLHLVKEGEDRPRIAIETAEAWARGGEDAPTLEQVRIDADADAAASAYFAAASAFAAAASSAAAAADAAADAAYADAADAYFAADAAAYSAARTAYSAARTATLAKCADIVRKHYPEPPKLEGL